MSFDIYIQKFLYGFDDILKMERHLFDFM